MEEEQNKRHKNEQKSPDLNFLKLQQQNSQTQLLPGKDQSDQTHKQFAKDENSQGQNAGALIMSSFGSKFIAGGFGSHTKNKSRQIGMLIQENSLQATSDPPINTSQNTPITAIINNVDKDKENQVFKQEDQKEPGKMFGAKFGMGLIMRQAHGTERKEAPSPDLLKSIVDETKNAENQRKLQQNDDQRRSLPIKDAQPGSSSTQDHTVEVMNTEARLAQIGTKLNSNDITEEEEYEYDPDAESNKAKSLLERAIEDHEIEIQFLRDLQNQREKDTMQKFNFHGKTVNLTKKSLCLFGSKNYIRKACIWLFTWTWFSHFITFCILINSVSLAIYDYRDRESISRNNKAIDLLNYVMTFIFLVEALIKIVAMGLVFDSNTYLRDGWNVIDILIVISGDNRYKHQPESFEDIEGDQASQNNQGQLVNEKIKQDGFYDDPYVFYGINSFNNFGQALLAVFQTMTADKWTNLMNNISDNYTTSFTQGYFCAIVIIGHYYMLQLLLAVIMTNLMKIQNQESYAVIQSKKELVIKDIKEIEEERNKINKNEKVISSADMIQNYMRKGTSKMMSQVTKEIQPQEKPVNHMALLMQAIEKKKKEDEQLANNALNKLSEKAPMITSMKKIPTAHAEEVIEAHQPSQGAKIFQNLLSKKLEEKFSSAIMQSLNKYGFQSKNIQTYDLSKGVGLALLSKVLGVNKIKEKYQVYLENIKRTKQINNMEIREKIQHRMQVEIGRILHKVDFNVVKMYWKSKKNVYGIENELQLVENIQKLLKLTFDRVDINSNKKITHKMIEAAFNDDSSPNQFNRFQDDAETKSLGLGYQLDLQMFLTLKIAYKLRELSSDQNVKEIFFARFKRRLIKKNIIENIHYKVDQYINETSVLKRGSRISIVKICNKIQNSKYFQILTIVLIIANSITLGVSYQGSNKDRVLENLNTAFFSFFILEIIIKITGRGIKNYLIDKFNWFDSFIILLSGIDIVLANTISISSSGSGAITAFRVLRLLRVMRLAHSWKSFQEMLEVLIMTVRDISSITVLFLVFIFTYMLIGMELYSQRVFASNMSPSTYNSLAEAFLSVFIVLANDGWTQIYFNHFHQAEPISTSIYFISLVMIGQFVLLNLMIAIIIENFEYHSVKNDLVDKLNNMEKEQMYAHMTFYQKFLALICNIYPKQRENEKAELEAEEDKEIEKAIDQKFIDEQIRIEKEKQQSKSLSLFSYENPVRQTLLGLLNKSSFEYIMICLIILNSVNLALDTPLLDPSSNMSYNLQKLDYLLSGLFVLEAVVKIIAVGFYNCGKTSYIRNSWNVLDFIVIIITIISYIVSSLDSNVKVVKIFRMLKVLRPLRAISKNQSLKLSIATLSVAIPDIFQVIGLCMLFFYVFGVVGVNYFMGQFYDCESPILSINQQNLFSKWDCINAGGYWKNQFQNFDNIGQAMSTLFIMSNTVSWSEIMYRATSLNGRDYAPEVDKINSKFPAIFFVLTIILGNFFLMNLFVGVIITKYNRQKELAGKDFMLTEQQKQWVQDRLMLLHTQPKIKMQLPKSEWRQPFFYIAQNSFFQGFIILCIFGNSIILGLSWYGQSQSMVKIIDQLNYIFTALFTAELIVNITAYSVRFFSDSWNIFDMLIIILSWAGILLTQLSTGYNFGPQMTIIKSFRISRLLFFFKGNRTLKGTIMTFMVTLPAMLNIGSLLLLIILIYSILGVYIFADIKLDNGYIDNNHSNFQSVGAAFVTLIRILTGESWPRLMEALSQNEKSVMNGKKLYNCIPNPSYEDYKANNYQTVGCGDETSARIYFFSYILIMSMIFIKVFIAIVLQNFQETVQKDSKFLSSELSENFRDVWAHFDPNATSFIQAKNYHRFLVYLGEPLGWDITYKHNYLKQREYLKEVSLPRQNNSKELYFMDIFEHLVLMMIIRREIINYALKTGHVELITSPETIVKQLSQMPLLHIEGQMEQESSNSMTPKKKAHQEGTELNAEEVPFKGITLHKLTKGFAAIPEEEIKGEIELSETYEKSHKDRRQSTQIFHKRGTSNDLTNFEINAPKSFTHKNSPIANQEQQYKKSYEARLMRSVHYSGGFLNKQDSIYTQGLDDPNNPYNQNNFSYDPSENSLKRQKTMDLTRENRKQKNSLVEDLEMGMLKELQVSLDEDAANQGIKAKYLFRNNRTMHHNQFSRSPLNQTVEGPHAAEILNSPRLGLADGASIIEEVSSEEREDLVDEELDQLNLDHLLNNS